MKTEQILERRFYNYTVRQNHKTECFNLSDMLKIANNYRKKQGLTRARIDRYLTQNTTKEFIKKLTEEEDNIDVLYTTGRGTKKEFWGHKFLFLDFVMWLSPDFKVKIYKWLYDNLAIFRDNSGDSYKQMASLISEKYGAGNVSLLVTETARKIKNVLQVTDWNKATEKQLEQRDKIHSNIILLLTADIDIQKATAIALRKSVAETSGYKGEVC